MAMFGGLAKKRSPFDFTPPIYSTPGIGDDLAGAKSMGDPGLGVAPAPQKDGINWLGVLADGLAGAAGQPGQYAAGLRREKELQRQDSLYQRQRADQMTDWQAKQAWKLANPDPVTPHYWETNDGSLGVVGPDGKPQLLYKDPTPKIDWITANNPDGTKTLVPMRQGGGGPDLGAAGGGSVAPASSSGGFMTLDQFKALRTVPTFRSGHPAWQTPVKVTTEAEMRELPSGKTFIAPDGSVRTKR